MNLICQVKVEWWLKYYLHGVVIFCKLTGSLPNHDKISYWVDKAVSVKVLNVPTEFVALRNDE